MWKAAVFLTHIFLTVIDIISCNLLIDGDERLKAEETMLTKIENKKDYFVTPLIEKETENYLQSPRIYQTYPKLQLGEVGMPALILQPASPPIYSNPVSTIANIPNFQTNVENNNGIFTNTYKHQYEDYSHILRDNAIVEYILNQIIKDVYGYNYIQQNQMYMTHSPSTPNILASGSGYVHTHPNPGLNTFSTTQLVHDFNYNGFYSQWRPDHQVKHANHIPQMYSQPQTVVYEAPIQTIFTPAEHSIAEKPHQGTAYESPSVEILKAVGYELPQQITNYHPGTVTKNYVFDIPSTDSPNHQQYVAPKRVKENVLYENWNRNNKTDKYQNHHIEADTVNQKKYLLNTKSSQYFHSNRKPITFENFQTENPATLVEIGQEANRLSENKTNWRNTTARSKPRKHNSRMPRRKTKINDNVAEDTNISIEINFKTKNKNEEKIETSFSG